MGHVLEPTAYRRWYETPLGRRADADEKALIFELADLKRGERLLDVGCGDGNYTGPAADRTGAAVGLDRSNAMLEAARRRLGGRSDIEWVQGNAERLPFREASFHVVLAITLLCFADDPQAAVSEMARILRPGGRLVLGELGRYSLWAVVRHVRGRLGSATWRHAHFFSGDELLDLADHAGLVESEVRAAVFYPPLQHRGLLAALRPLEVIGRRACIAGAAFLTLRAYRRA
jgi:SAM-dependent methyltransferase